MPRSIASVAGAELVAICSRSDESRNRAKADYPRAAVYADHREMLATEPLDVVDIVLPSDLHFSVACDVLAAGRHLLLEKPMALGVRECDKLVALAKQHGACWPWGTSCGCRRCGAK